MTAATPGAGPGVRTPVGDAPVIPVVVLGTGMYLAWFGVHYWRSDVRWPTDPVKAVLQGKGLPSPAGTPTDAEAALTAQLQQAATAQAELNAAAGGATPSVSNPNALGQAVASGLGSGSAIAQAALKYKGAGYTWGGNAASVGEWDCSSFVSYVLGHDLGLPLPGGHWGDAGFPPHSHGPTTFQYLLFGRPVSLAQVQAGDLVVSTEHIGIAVSGAEMISAQDEALGTGLGGFPGGFPAGPPHYRRVT